MFKIFATGITLLSFPTETKCTIANVCAVVVVLCGIHPATDQRQILPRPIKIVELTSWDESRAAAEKRIMNKA